MEESVHWLDVYVFPSGRLVYAADKVRQRLSEVERAGLGPFAEATLEAGREAIRLREQQRRPSAAKYGPEAKALDAKLDRSVSKIHKTLADLHRELGDTDPMGQQAGALQALFLSLIHI